MSATLDGILTTLRENYGRLVVTTEDVDESPWLSVDVGRFGPYDVREPPSWRLGVWRATGAVYCVDELGAAADDPIEDPNELVGEVHPL